jgi:hypothetical protein
MREFRPYGSVRGARSNVRPYRDLACSFERIVWYPRIGFSTECLTAYRSTMYISFVLALPPAGVTVP